MKLTNSQSYITPGGAESSQTVNERLRLGRTRDDKISLCEVVRQLEARGHSLESCMLLYFSKSQSIYVYCGCKSTIDNSCMIPLGDLPGELQLKYRKVRQIPISAPTPKVLVSSQPTPATNSSSRPKGKRTKERKIGEIIDKVAEWRKLYSGVKQSDGTIKKYSLEDAADMVGIAKKTLDDYLLQIRAGKKYGFDFNIHREAKVGMLRSFVKDKKEQDKGNAGASKPESGDDTDN